jgi:hypothetical protein
MQQRRKTEHFRSVELRATFVELCVSLIASPMTARMNGLATKCEPFPHNTLQEPSPSGASLSTTFLGGLIQVNLWPILPSIYRTSSVTTLNPTNALGPKIVDSATSVASRPRAIKIRPIRGVL